MVLGGHRVGPCFNNVSSVGLGSVCLSTAKNTLDDCVIEITQFYQEKLTLKLSTYNIFEGPTLPTST